MLTLPLYVTNTLPIEKTEKFEDFDVHVGWNVDRKERKKRKVNQNKCALVPKTTVIRKEEGATVAATPTFSSEKQCGQSRAGSLVFRLQAGPAAFT